MRLVGLYSLSRGHFESNTYLICELVKRLFTYSPFAIYFIENSRHSNWVDSYYKKKNI